VAPAASLPDVIAELNEAVVGALEDPAVVARMRAIGAEPYPTSPEEFGRFIRTEIDKRGKVVSQAGLKVN
jgi:tripartite-type tricarboxylate transporter receptor subunit TctC